MSGSQISNNQKLTNTTIEKLLNQKFTLNIDGNEKQLKNLHKNWKWTLIKKTKT